MVVNLRDSGLFFIVGSSGFIWVFWFLIFMFCNVFGISIFFCSVFSVLYLVWYLFCLVFGLGSFEVGGNCIF